MPRAEVQLRSRGQVPIALQDEAAPEEKRFSWSSRPRKWRALKTHCNQELADLYWLDILWVYGILCIYKGIIIYWLVVLTPLKNMKVSWEGLSVYYGK